MLISLVIVSVGLQICQCDNEFHNITEQFLIEVFVLTSALFQSTSSAFQWFSRQPEAH